MAIKIQKPRKKIEVEIFVSPAENRIKKSLQRLVNSCSADELELLADSAENPEIKQTALSALKAFSS